MRWWDGTRIIPARAGSTHEHLRLRHHGRRIIPARAGSTAWVTWVLDLLGDHPRSRGVDLRCSSLPSKSSGSSPLARGRHSAVRSVDETTGIIPARAGSTAHRPKAPPPCPDHPRSRGVDSTTRWRVARVTGSSPLARGRPGGDRGAPRWWGIIPARAGSTASRLSGRPKSPDHPRSRGVDVRGKRGERDGGGSSPLARGRPPMAADFSHVEVDHPRSRGVDTIPKRNLSSPSGSSPLARGRQ